MGFFGLPQGYNVFLHVEIWNLVYHGKFSHTDAYNLPIHLRKFYTRKLKAEADKTQESPTGDPGYSPLNKDGTIKKWDNTQKIITPVKKSMFPKK